MLKYSQLRVGAMTSQTRMREVSELGAQSSYGNFVQPQIIFQSPAQELLSEIGAPAWLISYARDRVTAAQERKARLHLHT